jgi:hypothetical protein
MASTPSCPKVLGRRLRAAGETELGDEFRRQRARAVDQGTAAVPAAST